jgi:glutamate synthase domain-containing protein 3
MLQLSQNKEIDQKYLKYFTKEDNVLKVNAEGLYYKDLNALLRQAIAEDGIKKIEIQNVCGQRYIGTNLDTNIPIEIYGTPGNDLGAFMNGPTLVVHGNAQDGCGNTMNEGKIIIHGHAGDVTGNSMRGGKIFVRDYVGYRVGIHMKEYQKKIPQIVIGQTAGDFLAEYMAGGIMVILGLNLKEGEKCKARFVGTGMHGGVIYERGEILEPVNGTRVEAVGKRDLQKIQLLVQEYCSYFNIDSQEIMNAKFKKILPKSKRPYEKLFSH